MLVLWSGGLPRPYGDGEGAAERALDGLVGVFQDWALSLSECLLHARMGSFLPWEARKVRQGKGKGKAPGVC